MMKENSLYNLCTDVSYGYTASAKANEIGAKFLRITDIANKRVEWDNVPFCEINNKNLVKYKLEDGDIVIARTGASTGANYIVGEKDPQNLVFASYLIRFRIDTKIACPKLVWYNLQSRRWKEYVAAILGGSAQPGANAKQLGAYMLTLPSLAEQKAIAEVLSCIDDKIDLLHRQNETLEEMAETLFRQRFVEENVTEFKPLGNCIRTMSGGTPSRKNKEFYDDGEIYWVKSKELRGGYILESEERITEAGLSKSSAKIIPENSTLVAMYGATVGQYAILGESATCNQAICACIPNDDFPYTYVYHVMKSNVQELISRAVGSAQQNISQVLIKSLQIPVHEVKIRAFHETIHPMMKKMKSNNRQIYTLEQMRDLLLPKLISGEVRVNF